MVGVAFRVCDVLRELSTCASLVSSRNVAQMLNCVLFSVSSGDLSATLTTCDSENSLVVKVPLVSVASDISFCVNVTDLLKALRNLSSDDEVSVDLTGSQLTFRYPNGVFVMPSFPVGDFPSGVLVDGERRRSVVPSDSLLYALDKTSVSVGNDPIRPILNSVNFRFSSGEVVVASTDGQRLVRVVVSGADGDDGVLTIPSRPSGVLRSLLSSGSTVSFEYSDRYVTASDGCFVLTSRLSEGNYPKYETIIPTGEADVVTVSKSDITGALRRIIPMGNMSSNLVVMSLRGGDMELSSEDTDFQKSAREHVSCSHDGSGITIGFNGSSFLGMISNMVGDDVQIELRQPHIACIIRPAVEYPSTGCIALIMPMSIL